ncbi:MAG: helicase [Deltaproteobacteria bacterium]|nr:helicase [Deltaproteobacteria bacterium]
MKIPYVIDNTEITLADILTDLLKQYAGQSLDTATAYFNVGGFSLIKEGLQMLGSFRLLLGEAPEGAERIGLRPEKNIVIKRLVSDLNATPFTEETLRLVEDLIGYLAQDRVEVRVYDKGFLHAKCWLFYSERPGQQMLFDRFRPVLAIVGSSNFTKAGLTSNNELNLTHKVLLDNAEARDEDAASAVRWLTEEKPSVRITDTNRQLIKSEVGARAIIELENWFSRQWNEASDFKAELIDLLNRSKFGQEEYTPYQVYMKALYEQFLEDINSADVSHITRSAIELAQFQEDAVKKARKILARYNGVIISDSVGLGKTWIGKKLLEDYAYHMRQRALVVCPASLRDMWKRELGQAAIHSDYVSQEELGRETFEIESYTDCDVILIDESHNFRNKNSQRYGNLERIIGSNRGRGDQGAPKKIILLTATPINNDLLDLYHQINLFTQGDRSYFSAVGIGDLYKYFLKARRESKANRLIGTEIFNLLEEIVIRRTRHYIKKAYPEATVKGRKINFPQRKLKTVKYDLEATYQHIYEQVVNGISQLKLSPYNLEVYKKEGVDIDEMEKGRQLALVGIFKSRYLKRFESSIEAFRISIRRSLAFLQTFEDYLLDGKLMRSSDFHKALRHIERDEEDDARPSSLAEEMDDSEEARQLLEQLETVDPADYDLRKINQDVRHDVEILSDIWRMVKDIGPEEDAKLARLKELLQNEFRNKKLIVFTYYKDTSRYLYRHLGHPDSEEARIFKESLGGVTIRRMDSDADPKEKLSIVQRFAPKANEKPDLVGSDREIDILISTDVLSEGQNLQDCGYLLNYDLHWNPTRMVQRAGRIDRIGTDFDTLWICNMFPDEGLEKLLGLVESLSRKIDGINQTGFLDSSILGETVNPRNFNTLRRIRDEDGAVIEEEEQFTELVSNEFLLQSLRNLLNTEGREMLEELPDGIHSGLVKPGNRGIFFYFQGRPEKGERLHFWKYYDLKTDEIIDNRFIIANLIACERDTPRVVDPDMFSKVFNVQEKVIKNILKSFDRQQALEKAPRTLDPIQQTIATTIQTYINHPDIDRGSAIAAIKFLNEPRLAVQIKELRELYKTFTKDGEAKQLIDKISHMIEKAGVKERQETTPSTSSRINLQREDLYLICFDFVS